ncbi:dihydrolipoamide acetyltransferase family protein [Aliibacillus thermotolerans]|uniref:Dihydrolipoamide acetyltransferase component of pyruvate dehydrogenase complex n=1 Tax=Aliibacillus thermotolerans TaxID=1834418 RepID=A0ABW0U752_9BACI|nr:dihydrolipoamide acetyltransferase family protein [Aliibacillus thermotolerans]MDA3131157.1 2-oxo acid dehydrogenase subunit E2 [Aliibacillus thermotolerans]
MAKEVTMPQLGESVTEGTISKWLKAEGDTVKKYEAIAEVTTDKVNAEIPSSYTGTITKIVAEEDTTIPVGEVICYMETEEAEEIQTETKEETIKHTQKEEQSDADQSMKTRYSPVVLRLATEHQIDLTKVTGTGKHGRITRKDVEKVIAEKENVHTPVNEDQKIAVPASIHEQGEKIPLSPVRKQIAHHTTKSYQEIPHAWMMTEADVTNLVRYREKIKEEFRQKEGYPITVFAFFVSIVVDALRQFPELNAVWGKDHLIQKNDIHLSIAVSPKDELYAPVLRHADEKSVRGIAKGIYQLAEKAKRSEITQEDLAGGTFTVNNTGAFGSIQSAPIINYPQAAIVSFEKIVKRPMVMEGDMIAIRHMVNICLSLDHRILDGRICGQFLQYIKERLEQFQPNEISIL